MQIIGATSGGKSRSVWLHCSAAVRGALASDCRGRSTADLTDEPLPPFLPRDFAG